MQQTNCMTILHASEVVPVVSALVASNSGIHCAEIPSFQDMLDSQPPVHKFAKNFDDVKNEPIVILHSSGSTGKYLINYYVSNQMIEQSRYTQTHHDDPRNLCRSRQ
jgi:acyl-coenzyme A synthetase/AMP-(fatty) acid ligase